MVLRILRFLAVLAVALFALRAYAHKIECEKDVGVVQLDEQGNVVLGEDGLPVFTAAPSNILTLDGYPAAVGWRVRLENLSTETSIVGGFEDPIFATSGVEVFGKVPAPGVAIPVGGSIDVVVVQRFASFQECAGVSVGILPVEDGPVCRDDRRDNVAVVWTHADAGGCRARIECRAEEPPILVVPPPQRPL